MKYVTIFMTLVLSGCGSFTMGDGVFNGRVVDAHWGGLIINSCEIDFQLGQQSSTISKGSTRNKDLCDKLSAKVGEVVTVRYKQWALPCCLTMDSAYEIFE